MMHGNKCVQVELGFATLASTWLAGTAFLTWSIVVDGKDLETIAGFWCVLVAATWTVSRAVVRNRLMLRYAYDMGVEAGEVRAALDRTAA